MFVVLRIFVAFVSLFTATCLQHQQGTQNDLSTFRTSHESTWDLENPLFDVYMIATPLRRSGAEQFLNETGLGKTTTFQDATLKSTLNREQLLEEGKIVPESEMPHHLQIGEIACTMSHQSALRRFLSSSDKQFGLFFEDDVWPEYSVEKELGMSFTEVINRMILARNSTKMDVMADGVLSPQILDPENSLYGAMLEFLDISGEELVRRNAGLKTWDLLNLGRCNDHCCAAGGESRKMDFPNLPKLQLVFSLMATCGHSYLVTRHGAQQLLEYGTPISEIVDDVMIHANWAGKLRQLSVTPRLFNQRENMGTLIHEIREKEFQKSAKINDTEVINTYQKPECYPYAFLYHKGCPKIKGYNYPPEADDMEIYWNRDLRNRIRHHYRQH
ncbi:hypothetical protein AAMO2058_000595400 [Amorphochlora amoebiformis]